MAVTLKFDEERITVGDLIEMEEHPDSIRTMVDVLAKLVVNGDGGYVEHDEGIKAIKRMSLAQMRGASEQIQEAAAGGNVDPK